MKLVDCGDLYLDIVLSYHRHTRTDRREYFYVAVYKPQFY